jgi:hypothetical protein
MTAVGVGQPVPLFGATRPHGTAKVVLGWPCRKYARQR